MLNAQLQINKYWQTDSLQAKPVHTNFNCFTADQPMETPQTPGKSVKLLTTPPVLYFT
jgi:hypothetical protein